MIEIEEVIILAGGFGTRLKNNIPNIPKPMADIAGKPFLQYILDQLVETRIKKVLLSTYYRGEVISNYFGLRYKNLVIDYIKDPYPLGTGGAILNCLSRVSNQSVIIMNGDSFLNLNFNKFISWLECNHSKLTVVVKKVNNTSRYGLVTLKDSKIDKFTEKEDNCPGYINTGIYALDTDCINKYEFEKKFSFEKSFLQKKCQFIKPQAYLCDKFFIDIGILADYEKAKRLLPMQIINDKNI